MIYVERDDGRNEPFIMSFESAQDFACYFDSENDRWRALNMFDEDHDDFMEPNRMMDDVIFTPIDDDEIKARISYYETILEKMKKGEKISWES